MLVFLSLLQGLHKSEQNSFNAYGSLIVKEHLCKIVIEGLVWPLTDFRLARSELQLSFGTSREYLGFVLQYLSVEIKSVNPNSVSVLANKPQSTPAYPGLECKASKVKGFKAKMCWASEKMK